MQKQEGYISVEGEARLFYQIIENGPETVIIPAGHALALDLLPLAQNRTVIFYDSRGRGNSDPIEDDTLIWTDYEVRDLEAVRIYFGLEQVALLGWSYLSGVGALYGMAHPNRVQRLILMCPLPIRSEAPYLTKKALMPYRERSEARLVLAEIEALEALKKAGIDQSDPMRYCRAHAEAYTKAQLGKPEVLAHRRSDPCISPNEYPDTWSKHWRTHLPPTSWERDWRQAAQALAMPTLLIHGLEDFGPLDNPREWIDTLPNARLLIMPKSGHWPHLEEPDRFFSAVDTFFMGGWPATAERKTDRRLVD